MISGEHVIEQKGSSGFVPEELIAAGDSGVGYVHEEQAEHRGS